MSSDPATTASTRPGTAARSGGGDGELHALVRLAATIARVPTAAINLFEHGLQRQPFTVGLAGEDTSQGESMCWSAARQTDGPTLVPDASVDPLFADSPWVDGRRAAVRMYVSYPLHDSDGALLGTLCAFDERPGELDDAQRAGLADLAVTAVALLEHRSAARTWAQWAQATEQRHDEDAARDARLIARQAAVVEAQAWVAEADLVPAVVADRICGAALDVAAATGAAVVEARGDRLVVRSTTGTLDGLLRAELSPAGSLAGRAVRWSTVVRCGTGDLDPADAQEALGRPVASMLAVPLSHAGTVVGAILVDGAGPDDLGPDEAEALDVLAAPFGAALAHAWAMEQAVRSATTDALTGLPGASAAVFVLGQALARQDRHGGHLALLLLDVDDFGHLNATYGPDVGDEVLRQVGTRLATTVRRVDTAARYAGDAFVVVAENIAQLEDGDLLARRLATAVAGDYAVSEGHVVRISASVGVALAPDVVTGTTPPMVERTTALVDAAHEDLAHRRALARVGEAAAVVPR